MNNYRIARELVRIAKRLVGDDKRMVSQAIQKATGRTPTNLQVKTTRDDQEYGVYEADISFRIPVEAGEKEKEVIRSLHLWGSPRYQREMKVSDVKSLGDEWLVKGSYHVGSVRS